MEITCVDAGETVDNPVEGTPLGTADLGRVPLAGESLLVFGDKWKVRHVSTIVGIGEETIIVYLQRF